MQQINYNKIYILLHILKNSIINFILDQGIDVCLWNYKGYTNKFKFEFPSFKVRYSL